MHDGHISTSVHVNGPAAGDLVVIATEAAIREIADLRLTPERAEQTGLTCIYGDPAKMARLRAIFAGRAKP